jgi:hypothetical protein
MRPRQVRYQAAPRPDNMTSKPNVYFQDRSQSLLGNHLRSSCAAGMILGFSSPLAKLTFQFPDLPVRKPIKVHKERGAFCVTRRSSSSLSRMEQASRFCVC